MRILQLGAVLSYVSYQSVLDAHKMKAVKQQETDRLESMKHVDWVQRAVLPETGKEGAAPSAQKKKK